MKTAILSIGYDRPEMLIRSMKSIYVMTDMAHADWHVFIDGDRRFDFVDDYPIKRVTVRRERLGLTRNILYALKEMFEIHEYDLVILIEDDVIVSQDFFRFIMAAHAIKPKNAFSISGYVAPHFAMRLAKADQGADKVTTFDWYSPWGVAFDRADYKLFGMHIDSDYVMSEQPYFTKHFRAEVSTKCPWLYDRFFDATGTAITPRQAGLINVIRAINGKEQMLPFRSRVQNIGYYGFHQPKRHYDGADLDSVDVQERAQHYTGLFEGSHEWESLKLI